MCSVGASQQRPPSSLNPTLPMNSLAVTLLTWFAFSLSPSRSTFLSSQLLNDSQIFFYALWQFFYWVKVEVVDHAKLEQDKTIVTSAKWLSEYQPHPVYLAIKKRIPWINPQPALIGIPLLLILKLLCKLISFPQLLSSSTRASP